MQQIRAERGGGGAEWWFAVGYGCGCGGWNELNSTGTSMHNKTEPRWTLHMDGVRQGMVLRRVCGGSSDEWQIAR